MTGRGFPSLGDQATVTTGGNRVPARLDVANHHRVKAPKTVPTGTMNKEATVSTHVPRVCFCRNTRRFLPTLGVCTHGPFACQIPSAPFTPRASRTEP